MLSFHAKKGVQFCDGLTRRDFLRVGALSAGAVGLNLADLTRLQGATKSSDINCILLFLVGGPSHLDTWDLKPNAPDNVRGPFRPIKTNVPGMEICEHFPLMAKRADRFSIVRSVYHKQSAVHGSGHQMMQTGHFFQGGKEHPHYGAVLSHLRGRDAGGLPPFVILPGPVGSIGDNLAVRAQASGPLGAKHEPFYLRSDAAEKGFKITDLQAPPGIDPARLKKRKDLLDAVDSAQRAFDATDSIRARDSAYEGAFDLLFAEKSKKAFDIATEDDRLRARYGRNTFGQSCLLARRLLQHGVRLVTVNMFDTVFNEICWDCHANGGDLNTNLMDYKESLCPMFDMAYTALLDDLKQRGMLDNTLVVAMGEFGRSPQLVGNNRLGRDHWPGCWSILFAGGRIKGGKVIGASDKIGAEPRDRPVSPDIVAATVYEGMGIDLSTARMVGPDDRPTPIIEADPIEELLR